MGCDIHLHTEVKINGVWHHMGAPSVPRNYRLFAKMAGVRGIETPIAEPRGLPGDATLLTRRDALKKFMMGGISTNAPAYGATAQRALSVSSTTRK